MADIKKQSKFVNHPLIKKDVIQHRKYQVNISATATKQNTLVVLPTALGKTIVALLALVRVLKNAPKSKILLVAPTRPLVHQHYKTFNRFLKPKVKCCMISSNLSPVNRALALNDHTVFFSTPQIIKNDVSKGLYDLSGFGQIIFDEGHKARKRYSYTFVARNYFEQCKHPLTLALTASPGKDLFRINQLCSTLKIEEIVFRNYESDDIKEYIHPTEEIIKQIEMPQAIFKSQLILDTAIRNIRDYLHKHDVLPKRNYSSKYQFIQVMQDMKKLDILLDPYLKPEDLERYNISCNQLNFPHLMEVFEKPAKSTPSRIAIISKIVNGIYLEHLKEILTTQSVKMYNNYIRKLKDRAKSGRKGLQKLLRSKYIKKTEELLNTVKQSPKLKEINKILMREIKLNTKFKIIVFVKYREMGQYLELYLNSSKHPLSKYLSAKRFVGQSTRNDNDKGMNQKEQAEIIRDFSSSNFNVLIATSVAEEGLDIPSVDAVLFFDTIPSEIRLIQRRGRTGRHQPGRCYYIVTKDTLDEIYHHVSHRRENKMHELLENPHLIDTCDNIVRSEEKPTFKELSIEEIKNKFERSKDLETSRRISKLKALEQELAKRKKENYASNPYVSRKSEYSSNKKSILNDQTKSFTSRARKILAKTENTKTQKIARQRIMRKFTKKHLEWILNTMDVLGSLRKGHLYCELDDIYNAAQEEGVETHKIEKQIDIGLKEGLFMNKRPYLVYKAP